MKTKQTKIIKTTFQKMSDIVTPTMGAKGRLAVLQDELSRPFLTDDGVTVAKECMNFEDAFEKMIAMSIIEAANNTEKRAFDGTTLTVLLTNEFYKAGLRLIKRGKHPQEAAKIIEKEIDEALAYIAKIKKPITDRNTVRNVANITTKIPVIGELVARAYDYAGNNMNVVIEHDRKSKESSIEHVDGMVIDSGYFSDEMKQLCDSEGKWEANNAKLILLAEGMLTRNGLNALFKSIENPNQPLVFILSKDFNPESLKIILDNLIQNKLKFMIVFINDSKPEEVFLDIAARSNGKIQSATLGTTDYSLEYAGTADKIIIEQDKTTILCKGDDKAIEARVKSYRKELEDKEFNTGMIRADVINRRLANLTAGVTKIKIAAQTITEYTTIRLKLDDAIGAVRCSCRDGILPGGGKALYITSLIKETKNIKQALQSPCLKIIENAGLKKPGRNVLETEDCGLDVNTNKVVNLYNEGIIDSFTSVDTAVRNAQSIACSYLKAYIIINQTA
jgi:chaperonin GroEL